MRQHRRVGGFFLLMKKAEQELAHHIISELPEYDKAQWAI